MVDEGNGLLRAKRLATYGRVNGIEDPQTIDVRDISHCDWVAKIVDFGFTIGEGWPQGKARAVRIAGLREVGPIALHFIGEFPICHRPLPGILTEMVEDIPEFREVACAPT